MTALQGTPRSVLIGLAASLTHLAVAAGAGLGTPAASLARGDLLAKQGRLLDAQGAYAASLSADPTNWRALCRASRVELDIAEDARGEAERQWIAAAVEHARGAVRSAPHEPLAHVALAVALGRQAQREGPKTRLALWREIKSEVERALALDPRLAAAYHVRGLWNRKLSTLGPLERGLAAGVLGGLPRGASMENAVRDLLRAVDLEPESVHHRLELGRTHLMRGNEAEARRELEKAVALPVTGGRRDPRYQAEARELLARLARRG